MTLIPDRSTLVSICPMPTDGRTASSQPPTSVCQSSPNAAPWNWFRVRK